MALDMAQVGLFRRGGSGAPKVKRGMPELTAANKTVAIGAAGIAVALVASWFVVLSPRGDAISAANEQTVTVAQQNDALRNQITALRAKQAALPALEKISTALDTRFPATAEQANFFKMITAAAASAGIAPQYLSNLGVTPPGDASPGAATSAQLPGVAAPMGQVASQTITLTVRGTPDQIRTFAANMEKLPRAFMVTSINLSTPAKNSGAATTGTTAGTAAAAPAPDANYSTAQITGLMYLMPKLVNPTDTGAKTSTSTGAASNSNKTVQ